MVNPIDLSHVHLPVDGLKIRAMPPVAPVPAVPTQTLQMNDALSAGSKRPERRSARARRLSKQVVLLEQRSQGDRREHHANVAAEVGTATYPLAFNQMAPAQQPSAKVLDERGSSGVVVDLKA